MKALVLVALIAMSLALTDNALKQGQIFDEVSTNELQHSRLGRTILQLAELASMSKSFDFTRLFLAIDELEGSIKTGILEEDALFDQDYTSYVDDSQFYAIQVTQYTTESAQHNQDLESLNLQLTYLQQYLEEKIEQLEQTSELRQKLEDLMATLATTFNSQMSDYDAAIGVLDQAVEILSELSSAPELLQTKHEEFLQLGNQIKARFDKFSHQRVFYQPLAEALIQMATDKFADQELTRKVIQLLEALRKSLSQGKLSLQTSYESQRQGNQELVDQYSVLVESLSEVVIPQLRDDIKNTNADVVTKTGLLSDSQSNLEQAQGNVQFTEDRYFKRQNSHKELQDQYNNDLLTISSALQTLERGGVRRQ